MYVKIGEKIKALRKRDDITQEYLAEVLGVTNQAVSKWESENSYPDIEYISPIANFFNVTIDYLFDHDTSGKQRKIDAYHEQYMKCLYEPLYYNKQIDIMRNALAEFPAEESLLLHLAQALFGKWCSYGSWTSGEKNGPDIEKHKSFDSWEEAMKIMEKLLASSTNDTNRARCRYMLASIYSAIGEKEKLRAVAEQCGNLYYSREHTLSQVLWGEDRIQSNQVLLGMLPHILQNTLFSLPTDTDMEIEKHELLIRFWKFIYRDDYGVYNSQMGILYDSYAAILYKTKPEEAVKAFEQSFAHAKMMEILDDEEDEKTYTSPYINRIKYSRENFGQRGWVRRLLERVTRDTYQPLREIASFNVLIKEIENWVNKGSLN